MIAVHCVSCSMSVFYVPKEKRQDISEMVKKGSFEKSDYSFLEKQTGLSEEGIQRLAEEERLGELPEFSEQYFEMPDYEREFMFFPIVITDRRLGELKTVPLKRGDVLVSLSTHTLGFRHGHAAIVSDGERGEIIEHMVLGELSDYSSIRTWKGYTNFAVLRYKDSRIAEEAVKFAEENLIGVPYNPLAGIIKKDKAKEKKISSSHCSHLVWQAFYAAGADIDGNGGRLVLPEDFLKCKDFETVQICGIKRR